MYSWKKRLAIVGLIILSMATGIGIILKTFNDNILFFYTPTDLIERQIQPSDKLIRVGGLVQMGSIVRLDPATIQFIIADGQNKLQVVYSGIVPNLFKEKQGTVAYGRLVSQNTVIAQELLAKHDENYMPPEVSKKLKSEKFQPN